MDNNFSSCTTVTFEALEHLSEDLCDFLDSYFDVSALNYTDDGKEEYVGYAPIDFDQTDLEQTARKANVLLPTYTLERLENKNWLTENVIKFDPIETSDFCIYGIHEKQAPKTRKHLLKIYAATAFGSGHQTTKGCLEAIGFLNKKRIFPQKILDIGTGSGILSLACAKIWQDHTPQITAVDIDPESVRVATQNAFDNRLEAFLSIAQSNGYQSDLVKKNAPYDLIMANILARPLIEMAPDLAKHLRPNGYCILSGFVADQVDWVLEAHQKEGLTTITEFRGDDWYAVLMEKKS